MQTLDLKSICIYYVCVLCVFSYMYVGHYIRKEIMRREEEVLREERNSNEIRES